jgi:hypothetical protein
MFIKQRHDGCTDCRFFNPNRPSRKCLPCGSGEFFEERVTDRAPTDNELMKLYSKMGFDHDDN